MHKLQLWQDSIVDETNSSQVAHEHYNENSVDAVSSSETSFPASKLAKHKKLY